METQNPERMRTLPPDVFLTRDLDVPQERVFRAWTDPKELVHWWSPDGFTNRVRKLDVRVGGAIVIDMIAPDGTVYPMSGTYTEVHAPSLLAFKAGALDGRGAFLFEFLTRIHFENLGGRTRVKVHLSFLWALSSAAFHLGGAEEGWSQQLGRLKAFVGSGGARKTPGNPD